MKMEHIYAVKTQEELIRYQQFASQIQPRLSKYIAFLEREYCVTDLPKAIVWTNWDIASNLVSNIPIPAYTNDFRVMITPNISSWREIYLRQLDALPMGKTRDSLNAYYSNALTTNHILQILGHELTHHSPLFPDDSSIWFEEGLVEYISRRYFLTEEEYEAEYQCNRTLVTCLNEKYGGQSLESFGASTYEGDYASIFFEYWRSFLTIHKIVEEHYGNVKSVLASCQHWQEAGKTVSLVDWFGVYL